MNTQETQQKINQLWFTGIEENVRLAIELAKGAKLPPPPSYEVLSEDLMYEVASDDYFDYSPESPAEFLADVQKHGITIWADKTHFDREKKVFDPADWLFLAPVVKSLHIWTGDLEFSQPRYPSLAAIAPALSVFKLEHIHINFRAFETQKYPKFWDLSLVKRFSYKWQERLFPIFEYAPDLEHLGVSEIDEFCSKDAMYQLLSQFPKLNSLSLEFVGEYEMTSWWASGYKILGFKVDANAILSVLPSFPNIKKLSLSAETDRPKEHQLYLPILSELTQLESLETKGAIRTS